jgi:hypothetical protein
VEHCLCTVEIEVQIGVRLARSWMHWLILHKIDTSTLNPFSRTAVQRDASDLLLEAWFVALDSGKKQNVLVTPGVVTESRARCNY